MPVMTAVPDITELRALQEQSERGVAQWAEGKLQRLAKRLERGQPVSRLHDELLTRLLASVERVEQRTAAELVIDYPPDLPVSGQRDQVLAAVRDHQVVVLTGETGSGKTTQLPKMLIEAGFGRRGVIGCTQPRRIAAHSVAARIGEEMQAADGVVASAVRFDDRTTDATRIKVMTDGLLLAEAVRDTELSVYDAIIIDEAHERSLNIDVLLGLLCRVREQRPDMRIVITSATIDAEGFAKYFASGDQAAPVINVSGRTYPVEVRYQPNVDDDLSYLDGALQAISAIHEDETAGDVLCFLPTERDILEGERRLRSQAGMRVLPLFGRLNAAEQHRVFAPTRERKVVLATNIAETSLTVPGIRYVVDAGLARVKRYAAASRTERLPIEAVSQASLAQRAGRAGRVGPGICVRLFAQADFDGRSAFTDPEIKRSNLAGVLLRHLAMNLGDPEQFPWLDAPSPSAWHQARRLVTELGGLESARRGRQELTAIGRRLAHMPVDPQIGRILLAGVELDCAHEVTTLAAFLSIQDPRLRPPEEAAKADQAQAEYIHEAGDLMTVLAWWDAYQASESNAARTRFCKKYYLSQRRMREWADLRHQLWRNLREDRELKSQVSPHPHAIDRRPIDAIHQSVLHGMLGNVAINDKRKRCYKGCGQREVHLHPSSALRRTRDGGKRQGLPEWVVACEVVETSRTFARLCAPIDPLWIERIAGDRVKRSYREPQWQTRGQRVVCLERVTWQGLPIVTSRRVTYAPIDPVDATRIFIRSALVEGGLKRPPGVVIANRELLDRAARVSARLRDPDVRVDDDSCVAAYGRILLPAAREEPVASADALTAWLRKYGEGRLRIDPADVIDPDLWERVERGFPETIVVGRREWPLVYRYAPGQSDDGVTLEVSESDLVWLRQLALDRVIPGLLPAQVEGLLKAMPKEIRRRLIPLQETARELVPQVEAIPIAVPDAVARAVGNYLQTSVPSPDPAVLSPELRLRLVVRDDDGRIRYDGRDIEDALAGVGGSDPLAPVRSLWATIPSRAWPGDMPKQVDEYGIRAWVGLLRDRAVDAGVAARRAVFATREGMTAWYRDGLEALLESNCEDRIAAHVAQVDVDEAKGAEVFGAPPRAIMRQLLVRSVVPPLDEDVRDEVAWQTALASAQATVERVAPQLRQLLALVVSEVGAIRKRLRRGLRGMAAAVGAQAASDDLARLFAPGWTGRLHWSELQRISIYVSAIQSRLDDSERSPDRARRALDRRRAWLQHWQASVGEVSVRIWQILGLVDEWRTLNGWLEEAIAGSGDEPGLGVRLQNAFRRFEQALDEYERMQRGVRGDLLEVRPVLERLAHDRQGRGILARLDATVRDFPDLGVGADLGAQHAAARDLLRRARQYIGA